MWFGFSDMSSGGKEKTEFKHIYIEAENLEEAETKFQAEFGRDPNNVTCGCCGPDFSISPLDTDLELFESISIDRRWMQQNAKIKVFPADDAGAARLAKFFSTEVVK